ncbi:MAG: FHA domain-containing protein [Gammaproteobacteria bacterium]|nr:FHA domain-containing protein [Gammaproteobacteria bacterium]
MSGKLEFSFNTNKIGEYSLDKEVMTIGRKDDNDIRIDNLAVSGHHAKLLTIFGDSFLEDLNSTNGTFVNGRSVAKHALKNGDVITIGKHELRYINYNNKPAAAPAGDIEKTVFIGAKTPKSAPANNSKPNLDERLKSAKLQLLNGKSSGKELFLEKESVRLGKPGMQVVSINRRPDGHFIVALEQTEECRPLKVNGVEIGSRSVKLQNHDIIEINQLKIEYYLGS